MARPDQVSVVHPVAATSGGYAEPRLSDENIFIADTRHGQHYIDTKMGRVFAQSVTPLGAAIPIYTATDLLAVPLVVNPVSSGVNIELLEISTAWVSGTSAFSAIGLMIRPYTAVTLSAYVASTPDNGIIGGGISSKTISSNAGQNTVSAGVAADWKRTIGFINLEANTATAHGASPSIVYKPDGTIIIPPGYFFYVAGTKASVALFATHFVWKEVPLIGA